MKYDEISGAFTKKIHEQVKYARDMAARANFTSKVKDLVTDETEFFKLSLEAVKNGFKDLIELQAKQLERLEESNPFELNTPTVEESIESDDHFNEINIDELISESYTAGKTDEEQVGDLIDDLDAVFDLYAHIFISIGIKLEENRRLNGIGGR